MLKVIGAGLPRTGTASVKAALERLGLGPSYHMSELRSHPEHLDRWLHAFADGPTDWARVFDGYQSTQDWPAALFWRELADAYPEAKVVLTVRDPHAWYKSFHALMTFPRKPPGENASPELRAASATMRQLAPFLNRRGKSILGPEWSFGPAMRDDEPGLVAAFHRHVETVQATLPAERLLVFDIRQGWEPLCAFLGLDTPDEPFPHLNTSETRQRMSDASAEGRFLTPFDAELQP
jgi:Sulfotransferase domain